MPVRLSRRGFARGAAISPFTLPAARKPGVAQTPDNGNAVRVSVAHPADGVSVRPEELGIVGVYDVDWLGHPEFDLLLDHLAASPRAFRGVRFFGALTAGDPEDFLPETGGRVWPSDAEAIDFTRTFDALEALTSRGLVPFISLGFFPPAVSSSPIDPPADWSAWQRLLRAFFEDLANDPRFGEDALAGWWFEVWNEPNEGRFWSGTQDQYFDLYRATSEVVASLDQPIRLGGPAIAYKPQEVPDFGEPWMERFLQFIAEDDMLRLDFVSLHRKGTVSDDPPDPRRLYDAAGATARQLLAIDPDRFADMPIINNEADEKVGFEVPYMPRMNEAGGAWLAAVTVLHATLDADYWESDLRFFGAADNINLQLVEEPFDGRRSIMTLATDDLGDLVKLPAYAFYELIPLLGDRQAMVTQGRDRFFPAMDLYHLATAGDGGIGCLLAYYPDPGSTGETHELEYVIEDIPWSRVNVALFAIDRERSNAWHAAGGSEDTPFPSPEPDRLGEIRQGQELALARPIDRDVAIEDGTWRERISLAPFETMFLWLTPFSDEIPTPPAEVTARLEGDDVVVQWSPSFAVNFASYELFLMNGDQPGERLSPEILRSAIWIDTSPPTGPRRYCVRVVSASGVASEIVVSDEIIVRRPDIG